MEEDIYFSEPLERQLNTWGYTLGNYAGFIQRLVDIGGSFLANGHITDREYNKVLNMIEKEIFKHQQHIRLDNK